MPNTFSKRSSWAWLVCVLLFSGFLLTSISSFWVTRGKMRETIIESTLPLTSDNVYSEIQRDLLRPIFISSLMANNAFVRDWAIRDDNDEEAMTRYLHEIKIKYGTVTSFFVSEKNKRYYHADGFLKTVREDEPRDDWYFRVSEMEEPYEINVDADLANSDEMTIFINYRTFDFSGNYIGATGVGLTVYSVNNLISRYEAKFDRQIYFVDAQGKIVLRPANSPLLSYSHLNEIAGLENYVDELLQGKLTKAAYERAGETRLLHSRYVPELDWYLIVEQSETASLAPIQEQLLINILIAVLVTVIVAYLCITSIRRDQAKFKARNDELLELNAEAEDHKQALENTATQLADANENLQQLNLEKDEFIGIVAHDLRNPLNGVIGFCDLALETDDHDTLQTYATDIKECGEHMLDLTQKLLDVSRIESFHGQLEFEDVSWNQVVEDTLQHFQEHAKKKKIKFECDLSATDGIVVQNRSDWLDVCVNNVISNAVKYTPACGHVEILTKLTEDQCSLVVTDSGPGISEEDQKKMFGKFVRLSARPTGNEPSSGLGLYIVKKMCNRLGMKVKVRSQIGKGTSFSLIQSLK